MRACVFTPDIAAVTNRRHVWDDALARLTGAHDIDLSVVGYRQTQPSAGGTAAYQPFVETEAYGRMRMANALFRLAEAGVGLRASAAFGLSLCGPSLVEAILACEPDAVLLDVAWGVRLKARLADEFNGPIHLLREVPARFPRLPDEPAVAGAKVSIVLPTHNGSAFLQQSIQSCLSQSHRNLELIVVDDGSAGDIRSGIAEFADRRVTLVRHEKNQGLPAALNTGFKQSTGDYLTWTSDDNFYAPDAIERLVRFLRRHPAIDFVYSSMFIVDEHDPSLPVRLQRSRPPSDLKRQNSIGACFLYTRRVYREIGDYDTSAALVEDYDYWVRVSRKFRMQRLMAPLYYYRYHPRSLTSQHSRADVARRFEAVRQQHRIA